MTEEIAGQKQSMGYQQHPSSYPGAPNMYAAQQAPMNNPYANDRQSYPARGVQPGPVSQPSFVHHTGPQGQQSFVHQLGPPVMMTAEQPLYAPQAQQPNALPPAVPGYYQASHLPYYSCIGNPNMPPGSYITMDKIPANINCPRCNTPIITKIKSKATAKTVVAAAAIGFIFWPLAFVPFMSRRMKKTVHVCPKCSHTLGKVVTVASVPSYQY